MLNTPSPEVTKFASSPTIKQWERIELGCLVLFVSVLTIWWSWGHYDNSDNFVYLADSFLHGRISLASWPGSVIATALYEGRHYVIEGPFPALLLLPFVAIFGAEPSVQVYASRIIGVIVVALMWCLFKSIGLSWLKRVCLCAFSFISTDLWWCASEGSVYFVGLVIAFGLCILGMWESVTKCRSWVLGIIAICSGLTRAPILPAVVILYPYFLIRGKRSLRPYLAICAVGLLAWVTYNEARWGRWYDIGYELFCEQDSGCTGGLTGLQYVPYQLYSYFIQGPQIVLNNLHILQYPYMNISLEGLALTFSSPALVISLYARKPAIMLTALCIWVPELFYYLNGWIQVGMRHALDFEAFLIVLMAYALKEARWRWWWGPVLIVSITVGVWQAWYAHTFRCC